MCGMLSMFVVKREFYLLPLERKYVYQNHPTLCYRKKCSLKTPITIQYRTFIITEDYESKESHIKISGRIHLPLPAKL